MRTTIELKDKLRAELLKRAAHRGDKGFSHIIEEALESYFSASERKDSVVKKALALKGTLGVQDAEALRLRTKEIREQWR